MSFWGSETLFFRSLKNKVWQKFLRGSGGDHPPRRRFGGRASKVFLLTLILILLPPKGGLGAQPQGFDSVFLPEGHHVQLNGHVPLGVGVNSPGEWSSCFVSASRYCFAG